MSDYDSHKPLTRAQQKDLDRVMQSDGSPEDALRAKRFNNGKPRPSLLPVELYEELITVLEVGAKKYGTDNWQKGMPYSEVLDSLERHIIQFKKGEDIDPDDGLPVLSKIAINALFLRFYQLKGRTSFDDRKNKI